MRLLFLGDIVGRAGRTVVCDALPGLIKRYGLDFVVINGENAAIKTAFATRFCPCRAM